MGYLRASAPVNGPSSSSRSTRARPSPGHGYRVPTPAIDALAANGIVFERAYSHVPQTVPAHAARTGRLPFEPACATASASRSKALNPGRNVADRRHQQPASCRVLAQGPASPRICFFDAQMTRGVAELPALTRSLATEQTSTG
jgi:hypothetical protein